MARRASVSEADRRWLKVLGTLNEYQARLFVAEKALAEGRGGISRLAQLTGMSRVTITRGQPNCTVGRRSFAPRPAESASWAAVGPRSRWSIQSSCVILSAFWNRARPGIR